MKKTWALIPFFLILTASCSTFKKKPNSEPESTSSRPGITLVMGGLGVYGLTHAGILRVLEKEEIPIKSLIAFQTGAFVASLYAESENSFTTEWKASQMSLDKYYSSPHIFSETSQTSVQPFKNFIRSKIQTTAIENLKIPLTILATDLLTGDSISIQKGHLIQAILSSNAIPGFFSPVQWSTHRVLISPAFGREFDLSKDSEVLVFVDVKGKKADPPLED
ncbi:MAG: patatin-like phospholipase family protein [Deltaproteobacteria bacterium]|nr:patatin-like phospholipase family protein [Deltaproteobacteria bacterium]